MNLLSLIVAGLLTVLTLAFTVMLVSAIVFNLKAGKNYRSSLATRIDQLRLSKMLSAVGIDVNSYLHTQNIVDIQEHMDRCSACENTDTCDEQLADGHIKVADIDFCNNEKSLQEIAHNKA
jgi:amino acid permease